MTLASADWKYKEKREMKQKNIKGLISEYFIS